MKRLSKLMENLKKGKQTLWEESYFSPTETNLSGGTEQWDMLQERMQAMWENDNKVVVD